MLEFPEVFWEGRPDPLAGGKKNRVAYFDAVVGNPPFAGKNGVIAGGGAQYLDWLKVVHPGAHGNADLCAHFFRRADHLLGPHGALGLVATNTIGQGDTRTTGLAALVARGGVIYDATVDLTWPAPGAAVTVSVVHMATGSVGKCVEEPVLRAVDAATGRLTARRVAVINSRLAARAERADPVGLRSNDDLSFQGSIVLGLGFTLTPEQRDALVARDERNAELTKPYLGGAEVNRNPDQGFDRYVIDFGDMTLSEAERWPDLIGIVRDKVKPERDKNKREVRRKYWWKFGERAPALYAALADISRCLVTARVTKHLCFSTQPPDSVFSEQLIVIVASARSSFATLQSRVHERWARALGSSMKQDLRYTPSDCFQNFPFPSPDPRT
ncbi:BREX-1 system adenine-specific DNA-methyltransferase PglX, partial [Enhygromyxa salina]|uniref:BREX-1 system adenine-specific DNA-methyltransferase PglX n=1 Tax=Enhygromyxa salina TaxID=215803 RepID=UPI002158E361